jgi:hypothetical protein
MTLMYWREYRTEFHIGLTYGIKWVNGLSHHPKGWKCANPVETISPAG